MEVLVFGPNACSPFFLEQPAPPPATEIEGEGGRKKEERSKQNYIQER
jgi:hypothetical protein